MKRKKKTSPKNNTPKFLTHRLAVVIAGLSVSLFALLLFAFPTTIPAQSDTPENKAEEQIIVKFKPEASTSEEQQSVKDIGGQVIDDINALDVKVIKVPRAKKADVLRKLAKNKKVETVESDEVVEALYVPNDPHFTTNQWGLYSLGSRTGTTPGSDIAVTDAWEVSTGEGVLVAILDTGIVQDHPDISPKIVLQKNFIYPTQSAADDHGHGTHVAGIVAAVTNNSQGVAGVCPDCLLMNAKVLGSSGAGNLSAVSDAIVWAADNGAKVINLSLGYQGSSKTLGAAVDYAWDKGVIVVAAAGNARSTLKYYPAAYTNAIAVAATDKTGFKANFSTYGADWVDVAAPGKTIFSTLPKNKVGMPRYGNWSGTSMASPMVAGVAGLVWGSPYGTSVTEVRARLEQTSDKIQGTGRLWSAGRVNASKAVGAPEDLIVPQPQTENPATPSATPGT